MVNIVDLFIRVMAHWSAESLLVWLVGLYSQTCLERGERHFIPVPRVSLPMDVSSSMQVFQTTKNTKYMISSTMKRCCCHFFLDTTADCNERC